MVFNVDSVNWSNWQFFCVFNDNQQIMDRTLFIMKTKYTHIKANEYEKNVRSDQITCFIFLSVYVVKGIM